MSQGTLLAGIGITETIVGIFTFRGKGWALKSNVVSQIAGIFVVFVVTTGLLTHHSSGIYAEHGGFWSLSAETLGIPLFQGVRSIFVICD